MDPVGLTILCIVVAVGGINDWWQNIWARITGNTEALEARRAQERQQAHEIRVQREQNRHTEAMNGRGFPTFGQSVGAGLGHRIRQGAPGRDQMGPVQGWLYDLCSDRLAEMTRQRRARDVRTAAGEAPWQKAWCWAGRRAGQYWENTQAKREEKRRRRDIPDAEWWPTEDDTTPATDAPEDPPRSTPPTADGPAPETPHDHPAPPPGASESRPGPVRVTAERIDTKSTPAGPPLALEPGWPDDNILAIPEPTAGAPVDEGEEPMGAALIPTRNALAKEARAAARHHPAAKAVRADVGNQLARTVGDYSVGEVNDTVALAAAWVVALRDKLDEVHGDLASQRITGVGMQKLDAAVADLSSAVTELHGSKGGFEFHERLIEEVGAQLQQAGIGSVRGTYAQDHIR